ncbi:fibronectin type III domain-containing protein [Propionicicella superfundia]|uniref:fibronectin type III domain-containing protein n=1 Tax=Propionicicella superfundia TaxID=348582 RepID=UPI0012EC3FBD|nr:fibronectin type III domain-containing protein [Propionicicella superfundia]
MTSALAAPPAHADDTIVDAADCTAVTTHLATSTEQTVRLTGDIGSADAPCPNAIVSGTKTLDLNGHSLFAGGGGSYRAGIGVSAGNSLTVVGDAASLLSATGGLYAAGIGGYDNSEGTGGGGSVTIRGGTVVATGGESGAGIGSGFLTGGGGSPAVLITGGSVTATGGLSGAGIGGGSGMLNAGGGGTVTVSGGTVTAVGGGPKSGSTGAAGIGAGRALSAPRGAGATLVVSGGTVSATGGSGAPGIAPGLTELTQAGSVSVLGGTLSVRPGSGGPSAIGWATAKSWPDTGVSGAGVLSIPTGAKLDIPAGKSLTLAGGLVTNSGSISVEGAVAGQGTVTNDGTIATSGAGTVSDDGTGDGVHGLRVEHNNYLVASADPVVALRVYAPTLAAGGASLPALADSDDRARRWYTASGVPMTNATALSGIAGAGPATIAIHPDYTASATAPVLTASGGTTSIGLSWTAAGTAQGTLTGYRVQYRPVSEDAWTVRDLGVTTTGMLSGLSPGTYQVRVGGLIDAAAGAWSAIVTASVTGTGTADWTGPNGILAPDAVLQRGDALRFTAGGLPPDTVIALTFDDAVIASGSTDAQGMLTADTSVPAGADVGTHTLGATMTDPTGTPTRLELAITVVDIPAPTLTVRGGMRSVALEWTPVASSPDALTGYAVQYRESSATQWETVSTTDSATEIDGLSPGSYRFRVAGLVEDAVGGWSEVAEATVTGTGALAWRGPTGTLLPGATLHPGEDLALAGLGLPPGTTVTLSIHSDPVVLATATVDAAGRFDLTGRVPATTTTGTHTLVAVLTDPAGGVVVTQMPIAVAPVRPAGTPTAAPEGTPAGRAAADSGPASAATLADTGIAPATSVLALLGLLTALAGASRLTRGRPRRP